MQLATLRSLDGAQQAKIAALERQLGQSRAELDKFVDRVTAAEDRMAAVKAEVWWPVWMGGRSDASAPRSNVLRCCSLPRSSGRGTRSHKEAGEDSTTASVVPGRFDEAGEGWHLV